MDQSLCPILAFRPRGPEVKEAIEARANIYVCMFMFDGDDHDDVAHSDEDDGDGDGDDSKDKAAEYYDEIQMAGLWW